MERINEDEEASGRIDMDLDSGPENGEKEIQGDDIAAVERPTDEQGLDEYEEDDEFQRCLAEHLESDSSVGENSQENSQEEGEGEDNQGPDAAAIHNIAQQPGFMQFLMRMMAQEAETKKKAKAPERKALPEDIFESGLLSCSHPLAALAHAALPPAAALIGQHVWRDILARLDSKSFRSAAATCWFLRQVFIEPLYSSLTSIL